MNMTLLKYNLELLTELKDFVRWDGKAEEDLLRDFVTYWSLRKSTALSTVSLINEIKTNNSNDWIVLIEANHKFRNKFGEEAAEGLIKIIENKNVKNKSKGRN